ncbi:hypothetical protein Pcinc_021402 [Petrolisthes cinctipes]|uniref:Uncharacterized protein n=1 Tax=Petrolisthes cinctipes TaxID=88211 RepID=A0AAE1FGC6_PETCI|nr:hypothetical protein Pcinc_021402 [Petrolisthes cinctipes]
MLTLIQGSTVPGCICEESTRQQHQHNISTITNTPPLPQRTSLIYSQPTPFPQPQHTILISSQPTQFPLPQHTILIYSQPTPFPRTHRTSLILSSTSHFISSAPF